MDDIMPGDVVRYTPQERQPGRSSVWDRRESSGQLYLVVENYGDTVRLYEPGRDNGFFWVAPENVTVESIANHSDAVLDALKDKRFWREGR